MVKMPLRTMTPPGVMLQILQDMVPAYKQNGPTCRTGFISALASFPDSLKEKLLLDAQCRGKLEDLRNSVQEISPEAALRMFHESIIQDNAPLVESRLQTIPNDLLLFLREFPDVQVPEELKQAPGWCDWNIKLLVLSVNAIYSW
ncbi:hypothetical protein TRIUR3_20870 [Triticum urartu]|uniref:Uncharacterized protein n=1 Tax=Triticum urartu TaxID=4572 RepID=M7YVN2_TRIUA|nr:hypothetical protein TRIUR3_20870 [Triticum urartu]